MSTDDDRDRTEGDAPGERSLSEAGADPNVERRERTTTQTITDSYVVLNRRVIERDPTAGTADR